MKTFRLRKFLLAQPIVLSEKTGRGPDSAISGVFTGSARTIEGRDRISRKRISWNPSSSPGVSGYRIYWAVNGKVGYDSDFADVGLVTALRLPDDVPSFPHVTSPMEIGVTALSRSGNESDMTIVSAFVDFARPEMPCNLKIRNMKEAGRW
jgi:hypothetical protein